MNFISPDLQDYISKHCSDETPLQAELHRKTWLSTLAPQMISSNTLGQFLKMIVMLHQPKCILEIGTFTGYSAIAMASALAEDGKLITIEIDEEKEALFTDYFQKSGLDHKIESHIGHAKDIIPSIPDEIDMVFMDADKENYPHYYELLINRLKPGALIISDNVLWSGKVIEPVKDKDRDTKGILKFNKMVQEDERVDNVLVSIRDGVMLARVR